MNSQGQKPATLSLSAIAPYTGLNSGNGGSAPRDRVEGRRGLLGRGPSVTACPGAPKAKRPRGRRRLTLGRSHTALFFPLISFPGKGFTERLSCPGLSSSRCDNCVLITDSLPVSGGEGGEGGLGSRGEETGWLPAAFAGSPSGLGAQAGRGGMNRTFWAWLRAVCVSGPCCASREKT